MPPFHTLDLSDGRRFVFKEIKTSVAEACASEIAMNVIMCTAQTASCWKYQSQIYFWGVCPSTFGGRVHNLTKYQQTRQTCLMPFASGQPILCFGLYKF